MGKTIVKKILPEYYEAVVEQRKTFELRSDVGDISVRGA